MKSNWQIKKIGEVCEVIAGQSPEGKYYNKLGNGLPFYQGKKGFGEKFIGDPTTWTTNITKEALHGDVLMSVRAPVGPVNFAKERICIGRGLAAIRATALIDKEFLFYFFLKHEKEIVGNTGAVFNSINKTKIGNILVPFPPLPEQKRIVKILDEVFEKTARAKENVEKNLQNASGLFESYLQSIFANPGAGWEVKTLGKIADIEYGYTDKAKVEGDYRYIRITDIDTNGFLLKEGKLYIKASHESKKFLLEDGDLLMARTGATFAKVLFFEKQEDSVFASYLIRIKFKLNIKNKLYWYFSKSKLYWDQAQKLSSGSAQPQFNGGALKQVKFSYPNSLSEQETIIKNLDMLAGETKKLEGIYQQKLADLEELKKSILQKAFKGELIEVQL